MHGDTLIRPNKENGVNSSQPMSCYDPSSTSHLKMYTPVNKPTKEQVNTFIAECLSQEGSDATAIGLDHIDNATCVKVREHGFDGKLVSIQYNDYYMAKQREHWATLDFSPPSFHHGNIIYDLPRRIHSWTNNNPPCLWNFDTTTLFPSILHALRNIFLNAKDAIRTCENGTTFVFTFIAAAGSVTKGRLNRKCQKYNREITKEGIDGTNFCRLLFIYVNQILTELEKFTKAGISVLPPRFEQQLLNSPFTYSHTTDGLPFRMYFYWKDGIDSWNPSVRSSLMATFTFRLRLPENFSPRRNTRIISPKKPQNLCLSLALSPLTLWLSNTEAISSRRKSRTVCTILMLHNCAKSRRHITLNLWNFTCH